MPMTACGLFIWCFFGALQVKGILLFYPSESVNLFTCICLFIRPVTFSAGNTVKTVGGECLVVC